MSTALRSSLNPRRGLIEESGGKPSHSKTSLLWSGCSFYNAAMDSPADTPESLLPHLA